jgi:RHS repeat-associated protein
MKNFSHFFSILCALALPPSFGGGWGEASAQVNLTLSAPRTQGGTVVAASSITLKPGFTFAASSATSLTLKLDANASTPYESGMPSLSPDQNYILTRTYKTDDGAGYLDQIQYFDGLGRPVQTVQPGITPSGKDLVTYQEYDGFGRESNAWLPAAINGNGAFQPLGQIQANAPSLNGGDGHPYSYPVYEPSPLNRVQQQFGPGEAWHTGGKSVKTEYLTNNANYPCVMFSVASAGLTQGSNYPEGELYVTKTTDEGGSVSYEFKDKLGQVVLTRQVNNGDNHDTYYVYDDFGNRRYVLPPLAVDNLASGLGDDSDMMKKYAYLYKYDGRNRCIQKRIPGCDWMYYVYDKADRLALTQDGIQRPDFKWTVYKYDKLGRMLYSSVVTDIRHKTSFAQSLESFSNVVVGEDFGVPAPYYPMDDTGYTRGFFWQPYYYPTRLLSVNYYDDHRFLELLPDSAIKTALQYTHEAGFDTRYENAKGLVTGGRQYQLDDSTKYTVTATYYDYRGRIVQTKSTNHLGGIEAEYIAYDFTGHPTQKKHVHTSPQVGTVTELYTYTYDHAGRPTETRHKLDGNPEQLLAKITYDELGRLQNRKAGNSSVVNTAYGYNVRSWTTGITGSRFKESLAYNFDGNIKQQVFGDNSSYSITYDFVYDDLSRLTDATSSGTYGSGYDCHYEYDKQGNAKSIVTNGTKWVYVPVPGKPMEKLVLSNVPYDNLTLTYNGNQLRKVTDAADVSTNSITEQFLDFANTDTEYAYNANGAMTKDLNKGITNISYNLLNLPQQIDINSPLAVATNKYSYSAGGVKLRVVKTYNSSIGEAPIEASVMLLDGESTASTVTQTTDYVGNKLFENNTLDRIQVDGGYIKGGVYYFYETDHLGSNRLTVSQTGTASDRSDYYPYGMQMAHNDPNQGATQQSDGFVKTSFKFSGKELDVMHGLNLYDSQARMQDPTLGRFTTVDPLAEKYYSWSPYVYCMDNPLKFVDKDGKEPTKPRVSSLTNLLKALNSKDIKSLKDMIAWYGGVNAKIYSVKGKGSLNERYVYSTTWGWIDMRHFSAAAYVTDKPFVSAKDLLKKGEATEKEQEEKGNRSAWSYEDLVSNALGAYFQEYASNYDGSVVEALESFLCSIGVVDNPIEVSPNKLPDVERENPPQNKSYNPMFTIGKRNSKTSLAIIGFIKRLMAGAPRKGPDGN